MEVHFTQEKWHRDHDLNCPGLGLGVLSNIPIDILMEVHFTQEKWPYNDIPRL